MSIGRRSYRRLIWERGNGCCGICGDPVDLGRMHVDHIYPRAWGGSDDLDNLQPSHRQCNLAKMNSRPGYMTTTAAALTLDFDPYRFRVLVNKGIIRAERSKYGTVAISEIEVERLQSIDLPSLYDSLLTPGRGRPPKSRLGRSALPAQP